MPKLAKYLISIWAGCSVLTLSLIIYHLIQLILLEA